MDCIIINAERFTGQGDSCSKSVWNEIRCSLPEPSSPVPPIGRRKSLGSSDHATRVLSPSSTSDILGRVFLPQGETVNAARRLVSSSGRYMLAKTINGATLAQADSAIEQVEASLTPSKKINVLPSGAAGCGCSSCEITG